jgi:hypothetical protein
MAKDKLNEKDRGYYTQVVTDIMKANRERPMAWTCAKIMQALDMNMSYARAWYRDFVNRDLAPGKIEDAPSRQETRDILAKVFGKDHKVVQAHGRTLEPAQRKAVKAAVKKAAKQKVAA